MTLTLSKCAVSSLFTVKTATKMCADFIKTGASTVRSYVNNGLSKREPWQIVAMTATSVLAGVWLWDFVTDEESIKKRVRTRIIKILRKWPANAKLMKTEIEKAETSFVEKTLQRYNGQDFITTLPTEGKSQEEILKLAEQYLQLGEYDWKGGSVSGAVYHWDPKKVNLLSSIYAMSLHTNPLHPDVFPGINKMEAEVVQMCCRLFNGPPNSCGTMTTGGTESILMAVKAYRDYAREVKGITKPVMVVPSSAHAAFDKAAEYFQVVIRHVPLTGDYTADVAKMRRAIGKNTIMLAGSAPNFPYGTTDDITAIGKLGLEYGIPVHVDACLGGFVLAFMEKAGLNAPAFDFRVPGVTSISADTHKYGYAPKGTSVILYSDIKFRRYQYCVTTDWPGGVYASQTVNGSRTGGVIATCWATLLSCGLSGYVEATKKLILVQKKITAGLRKVKGIDVLGNPCTTVIAIGSKHFDVLRIFDGMSARGWNLNPLQFPSALHLCVTMMHTEAGIAERFIRDIELEVAEVMKDPNAKNTGNSAIYGTTQKIPDRKFLGELITRYIDALYTTS